MNSLRLAALLLGLFFALVVRAASGPGGFQRLLSEGAWFGNAHHGHAVTLTGPGHATILTGTYPYRHGIIANEWT